MHKTYYIVWCCFLRQLLIIWFKLFLEVPKKIMNYCETFLINDVNETQMHSKDGNWNFLNDLWPYPYTRFNTTFNKQVIPTTHIYLYYLPCRSFKIIILLDTFESDIYDVIIWYYTQLQSGIWLNRTISTKIS